MKLLIIKILWRSSIIIIIVLKLVILILKLLIILILAIIIVLSLFLITSIVVSLIKILIRIKSLKYLFVNKILDFNGAYQNHATWMAITFPYPLVSCSFSFAFTAFAFTYSFAFRIIHSCRYLIKFNFIVVKHLCFF